jgi:hypothetical protein
VVRRLRADGQATEFQITGKGFDDTFMLCKESTGAVTVGDSTF